MLILGHELAGYSEPNLLESVDEGKQLSHAGKRGKGSGKKGAAIRQAQLATRFKASQRAHSRHAGKKLKREVKSFKDHLVKQIKLFQDDKLTFKRLQTRASIAFKTAVETAFKLGSKAMGLVTPTGQSHPLTAAEKKWLKSYVSEELGYFKKFLKQIRNNKSRKDVDRRVQAYADSTKSVYEAGRVMSAGTNTVIYWVLESGNPCPDCILLHKHSPYTPASLPTTPKAGSTRCRQNCYCSLRIDKVTPSKYRSVSRKAKKAGYYLRKIKQQQKKKVK